MAEPLRGSRSRSRPSRGGSSKPEEAASEGPAAWLCLRCGIELEPPESRHALASGGLLEEVCHLCYLIGLASQLVTVVRLSRAERIVLEEELGCVVRALEAHIRRATWADAP